MRIDAQVLIGPALAGLYLKDCLLLLRRDEAVLVRGWRGRWRAGFGRRDWRLGQREPWLCHPFKPWEPVLRLRWDAAAPAPAAVTRVSVPDEMRLGPWVTGIWLLLFVALPVSYFGHLGLHAVLAAVAELYLFILVTLVLVWRRRQPLGLTGSQFGVLAFEVLACPPYAANLVRRLSLHRQADEDLLAASQRLLDVRGRAAVDAQCLARIDDELDWLAEDSARALALRTARPRFVAAGDPPAETDATP